MTNFNNEVYMETVSAVTLVPSVEVGKVRQEGDEHYIYVFNAGNSQANPGNGMVASAVSGYSLTISSVTSVDFCMGHVKHATLTTAAYGWLLTKGFGQGDMHDDQSCAAGALVILAADGKLTNKTISTGFVAPAHGKAMAAIASGASGTFFFKCF